MTNSNHLVNSSLVIASLLLTYLILELIIFPGIITHTPLRLHDALGPHRLLAQISKQGTEPKDYIAIFGDSYAQGLGDWLVTADSNKNLPFHSAHIINQHTGRDVISFGQGGSDSIQGYILLPYRYLTRINRSLAFELDDPAEILVYFFEGNDIYDNLYRIERDYKPQFDINSIDDPDYFSGFINYLHNNEKELHENTVLVDSIPFAGALMRLLRTNIQGPAHPEEKHNNTSLVTDKINLVEIDGSILPLTRKSFANGPVLYASEQEIDLAIYMFEQALVNILQRFSNTPVHVIYIPSVLSSYKLAAGNIRTSGYRDIPGNEYPSDLVYQRSDSICKSIELVSKKHGVNFGDTRPMIRSESENTLLHGPQDITHFNKAGYTTLGKAVVTILNGSNSEYGCAALAELH